MDNNNINSGPGGCREFGANNGSEKAVRLVEYLIRITNLQRNLVKSTDNYQQVLWLQDIPKLKGCFAQVWGQNNEDDDTIWLEVQTRREPPLTRIPNICRNWIDVNILFDKTEIPMLNETCTRQVENLFWTEGSEQPQFFSEIDQLTDHPEIEKKWEQYLEEQWIPWTEEHNQWVLIHNVYSKLFAIYQEQLKLGEEYELIVGLGLLSWQLPDNQQIRRHLLVATALLEFESKLGKFIVRPGIDGANLRVELDMLESTQPPKAEELARQGLENAEDNPWAKKITDEVLQGIVHSIDSKGEYHDRLKSETPRTVNKPIVEYAPALILRKRSVRGLTETLRNLKEQLESGGAIPVEFGDLAEIQQSPVVLENKPHSYIAEQCKPLTNDGGIYFALPTNKEQRQIIEKLNQSNGILVQGPPGTGKSHTIANLICHLLANGKRILVTAKTPRALQVIESRLPDQIQPLCVNLLGSGTEERRSLENSVSSILQTTQNRQVEESRQQERELEEKLSNLRKEKAVIEKRLCSIREAETYSQVIIDGAYKGTAAQIAHFVKNYECKYGWWVDTVPFDVPCPIDNQVIINLLRLRALTYDKRQELGLYWPDTLPNADEISNLFSSERALINEEAQFGRGAESKFLEQVKRQNYFPIDEILQSLTTLQIHLRKLRMLPYDWVKSALEDIAVGHDAAWKELYSVTEKSLTSIADFVKEADKIEISYPEEFDLKALYQDAEKLNNYLLKGGKLGWGPFCSAVIRPLLYITKRIQVNGRKCKTNDEIDLMLKKLKVQLEIETLYHFWNGKTRVSTGPYIMQYHKFDAQLNALAGVLDARKIISSCQNVICDWYNELPIIWHSDEQINAFIQSCKLALVQGIKHDTAQKIIEITKPLQSATEQQKTHPLVLYLLEAISKRSVENIQIADRKFRELTHQKEMMLQADTVLENISSYAPQLAKELTETAGDTCWDQYLQDFQSAWDWARARSWLNDFINKEDIASLGDRLIQIDGEINLIVSELAAQKAWSFCLSRISEPHRRHMEAWQQHMRKLGKGTGKYAPFHRREAQNNLDRCHDAVPAWVMPLHRVWDTISPSAAMFDVIVIDEASQCGLESLPLFYLGKKILIVGDDKQISPDAVGIPQDAVHRLMDEYLNDFNFKTSFDVTSSLFDQAKLRYSTRKIVLREHFRCMPEIIRFSNDLCYSGEPLIPLRQYGPDRLKPLQNIYVQGGFREGSGNRVINRPEAEAVVHKIVELCNDSRYDKKTMGVIILQGEAQGTLIESLLLDKLGTEEMARRRIICGNPYSFQGDERDVIFMSMVAAPNERIGTLSKSTDEQRFNVAASRAKDQMWLFHSVSRNDLSKFCFRAKLLEFFEQTRINPIAGVNCEELERKIFDSNRSIVKAPGPFDSWFEVDLALELARRKYQVIPQFEVAGKYIDLVVDGGGARIAVECDGDALHGADKYEQDMERQKVLERCGWPFFRIRESEFYYKKESVLNRLFQVLENRGIFPIGMEVYDDNMKSISEVKQNSDEIDNHGGASEAYPTPPSKDETFALSQTDTPCNIHEALQMKYPVLRDVIIATLRLRPNQSCVKEAVVKYLLQYLEIISRGKPRDTFAYKVDRILMLD